MSTSCLITQRRIQQYTPVPLVLHFTLYVIAEISQNTNFYLVLVLRKVAILRLLRYIQQLFLANLMQCKVCTILKELLKARNFAIFERLGKRRNGELRQRTTRRRLTGRPPPPSRSPWGGRRCPPPGHANVLVRAASTGRPTSSSAVSEHRPTSSSAVSGAG